MAAFYVYITEQCKKDAAKHTVTKDVLKLKEKLEEEQSDRGLDRYPPPYRKKVIGRPGRLIIEERRIDDDIILCFVRYFTRGNPKYKKEFRNYSGSQLIDITCDFFEDFVIPEFL